MEKVVTPNCDYSQLEKFLADGNWKEANDETWLVLLKVAKRKRKGYLDYDSIKNFPCEDLKIIDQLWVKHSNGHFGFSVQKHLLQEKCVDDDDDDDDDDDFADNGYEYKIYDSQRKLGDVVGWRVDNSWKEEEDLDFSLNAPVGHLPFRKEEEDRSSAFFEDGVCYLDEWYDDSDWMLRRDFFFYRVEMCKLG